MQQVVANLRRDFPRLAASDPRSLKRDAVHILKTFQPPHRGRPNDDDDGTNMTKFPLLSVAGAPSRGVTVTGPKPVLQITKTSLAILAGRVLGRLEPKIPEGYAKVLSLLL